MALGRPVSFQFIPGRNSDSDTENKCAVIMLPWQSGRERVYIYICVCVCVCMTMGVLGSLFWNSNDFIKPSFTCDQEHVSASETNC